MKPLRSQRGIGGAMIAIVLIVIVVGALAAMALSRIVAGARAADQVSVRFDALAAAIEQFAASTGRLPCPANPALSSTDAASGDEVVPSPNVGVCTFAAGTVPWRTIGARAEDAVDSWGWKISYRVFQGSPGIAGSLTQADGVSMVKCDEVEPSPGLTTTVAGVTGGLCSPDSDTSPPNVNLRNTFWEFFLTGKGLTVIEKADPLAVLRSIPDAAYVLISHGPSGIGGYTTEGNRNSEPAEPGDERGNTRETGPFVVRPFLSDVSPTDAAHFDDRVFYRTLPDLIRRTGLVQRDWPDPPPPRSVTFDQAALEAALGSPLSPGPEGSLGEVTVTFTGVVATGIANNAAANLSYAEAGGYSGIGVAGGGSALIQSAANELVVLEFETTPPNTKFAATLGDFGTYSGSYSEVAGFFFFSGGITGTLVGARGGSGCNIDGGLASFYVDVGTAFDTVAVVSIPALNSDAPASPGLSAFFVAAVAACPSDAASCFTPLSDARNACPLLPP